MFRNIYKSEEWKSSSTVIVLFILTRHFQAPVQECLKGVESEHMHKS